MYARVFLSAASSSTILIPRHLLQAGSVHSLSFGRGGGKQNPWLCEELQEHIMIMARLATKKYGRENHALVLGHSVPSEVVRECLQVCCSLKRSWVLAGDNRVLFFLG